MANKTAAQRVAQEVRANMARRGRTQSDIATALGISQTAISRRLSGSVPWDVNELELVATALDVPIAELLPTEASA